MPAAIFWADEGVDNGVKVNEKWDEREIWPNNSSEDFRFSSFPCLVHYWQSFSHR